MKGFKNSTKTQSGHHFPGSAKHHLAGGGIVSPLGGMSGRMGGPSAPRPLMPRPRVMPNPQAATMKAGAQPNLARLARGGKVPNDGAGPYNNPEGNTLELANRPYSKIEQDHPRRDARPGYSKGGPKIKKGALHHDMHIPAGQKIPRGAIRAKLARDKASGNKKGVKRDVFALNFGKKCDGGKVGYADGGAVDCDAGDMQNVAQKAVNRHVRTPPPQGHGVQPKGGLAFVNKPMFGKG